MRKLLEDILDKAGFKKLAFNDPLPNPVIDQEGDRGTGGIAAEPRTTRERSNRFTSGTAGFLAQKTRKNEDREKVFGSGRGRLADIEPDDNIEVSSKMDWER